MTKRGKRCLLSLILGLCFLMLSQISVLAADVQEDSIFVQAIEEAMPELNPPAYVADLTISKVVKGSAANPSEHFSFVLTAVRMAGTSLSVTYTGIQDCEENHAEQVKFDESGVAKIVLKNNESITLHDISSGELSVKEENENYWTDVNVNSSQADYNQNEGMILSIGNENITVVFTNQIENQPETGIFIMTFPYLMVIFIIIIIGIYWWVKRKSGLC